MFANKMEVTVPISKSIAARLLVINLLCGDNPSHLLRGESDICEDIEVMQTAVSTLHNASDEVVINLKDSGTAKRLLTAVCACTEGLKCRLRMSDRLGERPVHTLLEWLNVCTTAKISSPEQTELYIEGGKFVGLDAPRHFSDWKSSQTLTALMLVAPTGNKPFELTLDENIVSLPYIRMTAGLMRRCGIDIEFEPPYRRMTILPGVYTKPTADMLERDWSAAAFFYEYSYVTGRQIDIKGLTAPSESLQGDSTIAGIFSNADKYVCLNMCDTPDLVPAAAVGFALKGVPFKLYGISHLKYKESDRLEALRQILDCFSIEVKVDADSIEMPRGQMARRPQGIVPCFNDHRMAMALAPAMRIFPGMRIDNPDCVNKSFPQFWEQIRQL